MKTLSKLLVALFLLMAFPQTGEASFTANKQYNNQTTGSNINTWGIVLNSNFTTIDNNLGGTLTLSVAGNSNVTLTVTQAQSLIYDFTGVLTGNIVIYFPAQGGFYYVNNQTTGAYTITIESTGDSSGIIVPQGGGLPIIVDNSTSPPTTFSPNYASAGANSNITSLTGLTTPLSAAQGGSSIYVGGTSGGSANAQTLATVVPANFALTAGNIVTGIAGYTNSGATTLAVNSLAATAMRKENPAGLVALSGGEIISGSSYLWYYDGTYFILMNPSLGASAYLNQAFTTAGTIASATTTDLGSVATNIQTISGTTTITGFGSSASAANPLYFITFSGALTLTNNATSLILPGGANITTAAGDTAVAEYLGSGDWQVISYNPASGAPIESISSLLNGIGNTQGDILYQNGTGWTVLAPGTSGKVLTTGGASANPSWTSPNTGMTLLSKISPSGNISSTQSSIPAAKQIIVNYASLNTGSSGLTLQIGPTGGLANSGYNGVHFKIGGSLGAESSAITLSTSTSAEVTGTTTLNLLDATNNIWAWTSMVSDISNAVLVISSGEVTLSGTLTQVQLGGGGTFGAGSWQVSYQ